MPKSAIDSYKMWIVNSPESWHPTTLDFFYFFVHKIVMISKKERGREWLEKNLREDCPNLSKKDIDKYWELFYHLRDFKTVHKSSTAKLIAKSLHEKELEEARKKYL